MKCTVCSKVKKPKNFYKGMKHCKECQIEKVKKCRDARKEYYLQYRLDYTKSTRASRPVREKRPDRKEWAKEYYIKNRERPLQYAKDYQLAVSADPVRRAARRQYMRQWKKRVRVKRLLDGI